MWLMSFCLGGGMTCGGIFPMGQAVAEFSLLVYQLQRIPDMMMHRASLLRPL